MNSVIQTLSSLAIVSVFVSIIVQYVKNHPKVQAKAPIILFVVSMVAGIIYFFVSKLQSWPMILADIGTIFSFANAFYLVVFKWFESPSTGQ